MQTEQQNAKIPRAAEHANPNYSTYSCEELDREVVDAAREIDKSHTRLERELKQRLLPALKELRTRYKRPGARTDLGKLGAPTWSEYLSSRGLNPDTVRKWFLRSDDARVAERLLKSSPPTSGTCPGGSKKQVDAGSAQLGSDSPTKFARSAEENHECTFNHVPYSCETSLKEVNHHACPRLYEVEVTVSSEGLPEIVRVYLLDCDEEKARTRAEAMVAHHAEVTFDHITAGDVREVDHVLVGDNVDSGGHQSAVPTQMKRPPASSPHEGDGLKGVGRLAGLMAKLDTWQ